jgi:hypothetical protein
MANENILPDSRLQNPTRVMRNVASTRFRVPRNWVPIFCANCGCDGGYVPEENCNFAFYLCMPCAERLGPISNTYIEPDAVFWEKVKQEQLERYRRELTAQELAEILKDDAHPLTRLAKDRATRGA